MREEFTIPMEIRHNLGVKREKKGIVGKGVLFSNRAFFQTIYQNSQFFSLCRLHRNAVNVKYPVCLFFEDNQVSFTNNSRIHQHGVNFGLIKSRVYIRNTLKERLGLQRNMHYAVIS